MILIEKVHPQSLAATLGLEPRTQLLAVDGRELTDFLDWEFLTADDRFTLSTVTPEGERVDYDIERPEGVPMGVELEPPRIRRCANRCDFCFVDGNPRGMRETLYIRDDDYRLSFRYGNFATLTNLKEWDVRRILEYRLSPLYISVHATDPVIRRRLLRNPTAPDVMAQLRDLLDGDIECHTQIVLQPGVNDGPVLKQSLTDLYSLGPSVLSVSVVPVGLTEFSKHNKVREPTHEECADALRCVDACAERALSERGHHWAYGSDDLYIVARMPLPPAERYDGFEQVENGVGSVRYLQRAVGGVTTNLADLRIAVVTGVAMGGLMPEVLSPLEDITGGEFELIVVANDLFGASVTTAGLLPGESFRKALQGRHDIDIALLPAEAVNEDAILVDDMTLDELESAVPTEIRLSYNFADALGEAR
ncbi:MAG: DUF512 domain-containing protein [Gemmatimonadales bacterium]